MFPMEIWWPKCPDRDYLLLFMTLNSTQSINQQWKSSKWISPFPYLVQLDTGYRIQIVCFPGKGEAKYTICGIKVKKSDPWKIQVIFHLIWFEESYHSAFSLKKSLCKLHLMGYMMYHLWTCFLQYVHSKKSSFPMESELFSEWTDYISMISMGDI